MQAALQLEGVDPSILKDLFNQTLGNETNLDPQWACFTEHFATLVSLKILKFSKLTLFYLIKNL